MFNVNVKRRHFDMEIFGFLCITTNFSRALQPSKTLPFIWYQNKFWYTTPWFRDIWNLVNVSLCWRLADTADGVTSLQAINALGKKNKISKVLNKTGINIIEAVSHKTLWYIYIKIRFDIIPKVKILSREYRCCCVKIQNAEDQRCKSIGRAQNEITEAFDVW